MTKAVTGALLTALILYVIGLRLIAVWDTSTSEVSIIVAAVMILLGSTVIGATLPEVLRQYRV